MNDIKEAHGLEVVGYLLAKGRALSIWPANKDTDEPLCRLSDATAVIDQLRKQLDEARKLLKKYGYATGDLDGRVDAWLEATGNR